MKSWPGHLPVTCIALFSILERAAMDENEFSRDERVLFTACEFWAAVSANELRAHLASQPAERLRMAGIALTSLGAVVLAPAVFVGIDELRKMATPERRDEYIACLERQLQMTEDSVDELIALMAERCISGATPIRPAAVDIHFR